MQPARIKPHAKEHTNNPVQRPHCRGQGRQATSVMLRLLDCLRGEKVWGPVWYGDRRV